MLYVIGTGRKAEDITLSGINALQSADKVVIKSQNTHMLEMTQLLKLSNVESFDRLYEQAEDFDHLNSLIASELTLLTQKFGKVAFCVLGKGYDDSTVELLKQLNIPFQMIVGVSSDADVEFADVESGTCVSYTATQLLTNPPVDINQENLFVVKAIDDKFVASEVKLWLSNHFDIDSTVYFYDGEKVKNITLQQLDRQQFDYRTVIAVKAKHLNERSVHSYGDVLKVMSRLRAPDGCPWDKAQTHESLTKAVLEESYELVNAIDNGDIENIIEELGDVLMQVAFHINIAEQEGEFYASDVYSRLCNKLITRHPHVFGDVKPSATPEEALANWESVKQKEHKINNLSQNLLDVPRSMSALMRAQKLQSRARKGGYDFQDLDSAVSKVNEELNELLTEKRNNDNEKMSKEGGDLLFAVVNLLRLLDVDSETALLKSSQKFVSRVLACEEILSKEGKQLTELSQDEFDLLWEKVKKNER